MDLFKTLSRIARVIARNPQARRGAENLARESVRRWRNRSDTGNPQTASPAKARAARSRQAHPNASPTGSLPDRAPHPPLAIVYAPRSDANADPGEIVWAWVPFEDDPTQGKDRPLLVLAVEGEGVDAVAVGLMLTSRDRGQGDHTDQHGNRWVDIGTGDWDRQGRPSEVRINRLIQVKADSMRREGGKLDRATFERVAKATREEHGW